MKFEKPKTDRDDRESMIVAALVFLGGLGLFVWSASSLIKTIGCVP